MDVYVDILLALLWFYWFYFYFLWFYWRKFCWQSWELGSLCLWKPQLFHGDFQQPFQDVRMRQVTKPQGWGCWCFFQTPATEKWWKGATLPYFFLPNGKGGNIAPHIPTYTSAPSSAPWGINFHLEVGLVEIWRYLVDSKPPRSNTHELIGLVLWLFWRCCFLQRSQQLLL